MPPRIARLRYLLDTDTIIYLVHRRSDAVAARFARLRPVEVAMSCITFGELRFGAEKSGRRVESMAALDRLVGRIAVLPLDVPASEAYGRVRAALETGGRPMGNNDLWIAAHALSAGLTLVTNNEREFSRVAALKTENWT